MSNQPIMSAEDEKYMAWSGLIQWIEGVIAQSERVKDAAQNIQEMIGGGDHVKALNRLHCEAHYYSVAANKVFEYKEWAQSFGLFKNIDFSELDAENAKDIKDLRNMREHIVGYFQGKGHAANRWVVSTTEFSADASSMVNTSIGGRLDYIQFTDACRAIEPRLRTEPIPYTPTSI